MNEFLKQNGLFTLEDSVEKIHIDDLRKYYCNFLRDSCDDDTEVRNLAARVLPEIDVEGNSYFVPNVVDIVESLVMMVESLRLQKNWDEFNKSFENEK